MMSLPAQVVINEFSCSNYSLNIAGNNEDFVELFNETGTAVDLGGWHLSDDLDDPTKFAIPAGTVVPPNGYLVIMCSSEAQAGNLYAGGFLNTNFRIHQCKEESVVLADPSGAVVESYTYGTDVSPNQEDHSWARKPMAREDGRSAPIRRPTPQTQALRLPCSKATPMPLMKRRISRGGLLFGPFRPGGHGCALHLGWLQADCGEPALLCSDRPLRRRWFGPWWWIRPAFWPPVSWRRTRISSVTMPTPSVWCA